MRPSTVEEEQAFPSDAVRQCFPRIAARMICRAAAMASRDLQRIACVSTPPCSRKVSLSAGVKFGRASFG